MPEPLVFKNASVYGDDTKHGLCTKATLDLNSGGEAQITDDGWQGHSNGKHTSKLTVDSLVCQTTRLEQIKIYQAWKNSKYIAMGFGIVHGQLLKLGKMKINTLKYDTDAVKGTITLNFDAEGGKPEEG